MKKNTSLLVIIAFLIVVGVAFVFVKFHGKAAEDSLERMSEIKYVKIDNFDKKLDNKLAKILYTTGFGTDADKVDTNEYAQAATENIRFDFYTNNDEKLYTLGFDEHSKTMDLYVQYNFGETHQIYSNKVLNYIESQLKELGYYYE